MSRFIDRISDLSSVPYVSGALGGVLGLLSYLYGVDNRGVLYVLIVCMVLDYLTGLILGYVNGKLSSKVGFKGIAKKLAIMVIVALGHLFDSFLFKNGAILMQVCIYFYIANEGLSIVENCANLGLPVPKKLKNALAQLKESSEDGSSVLSDLDDTDDEQ